MTRIAVLADVHGNVPALEAVIEDVTSQQPDEVLVGGDLVGRGLVAQNGVLYVTQTPQIADWMRKLKRAPVAIGIWRVDISHNKLLDAARYAWLHWTG